MTKFGALPGTVKDGDEGRGAKYAPSILNLEEEEEVATNVTSAMLKLWLWCGNLVMGQELLHPWLSSWMSAQFHPSMSILHTIILDKYV